MPDSNRLQTINNSRVLRSVRLNPRISRIKVAEDLNLDRSTVTKIVQTLLEKDIIRTAGKNTVKTGVGRKQIGLIVNDDFGVIIGIEVQNVKCSAVVASLSGEILHSFSGPVPQDVNPETIPSIILSVINRAKEFVSGEKLKLLGIGIALPGIIDPFNGMVVRSGPLSVVEPFNLVEILSKKCRDHIFIENDANCCCWGELAFNPEGRSRDFIAVLGEFNRSVNSRGEQAGGFAVGLGFAVGERVHHGDHFTAGEFRSFVMRDPKLTQFSFSPEELESLPDDGQWLERVYRELCENLAFLVNCFDFTKIIFTGDIPRYQGRLKELLLEAVSANCLYDIPKNIQIDFSTSGSFSVALGAAGLFAEKLFSIPDMTRADGGLVGYGLFEHIS